jgi:hypothetical protein
VLRNLEVSGVEGGWGVPPDAIVPRTDFPPVKPGRVVGLGAICALRPRRFDEARSQSFSVSEFVTLEDGRRVILHEARGFTIGLRSTGESGSGELREHETLESVTRNVLTVVRPDDDECAEDHPWSWLAGLARARGLNVTAEELRGLPYEVIFTDTVRQWLVSD